MIADILLDGFNSQAAQSKSPPFDSSVDWQAERDKQTALAQQWKAFSPTEQASYPRGIEQFLRASSALDLKSPEAHQAKNLYLLRGEISARIRDRDYLKLLNVEELDFSSSLLELLENTENTEHIRELYRLRKRNIGSSKNAGISEAEALKVRNCLRQGRELYLSGRGGSLMVKPLNFFYSLSAYAYSIIILNNPIRYTLESLPGSHGLNYLPDVLKCQFGGDIKEGTFSELFASYAGLKIRDTRVDIVQDNADSILAFYKNRVTASIGTLLSMIPEIRDYYKLITGLQSRTHPLDISTNHDARGIKWEFQIGDGLSRPSPSDVQNAFGDFERGDRYGKTIISVPLAEAHRVRATVYSDIRGRFWYIENPFYPIILPELCTHFLLTNAFSNIMRYSPDTWGEILSNEVHSDISLMTRKYLSAFENKLPALILRSVSKFHPLVTGSSQSST